MPSPTRRQALQSLAATGSLLVAGCLDETATPTADEQGPDSDSPTETPEANSTGTWPMFGADAGNSGYTRAGTGPGDTGTIAWRFDGGTPTLNASPVYVDGTVYTAVNLKSTVDQATVHCEPVTLENALADGHDSFDCSVAVRFRENDPANDPVVISACGVCRELLYDYDPTLDVLVRLDGELRKVALAELLPARA